MKKERNAVYFFCEENLILSAMMLSNFFRCESCGVAMVKKRRPESERQ